MATTYELIASTTLGSAAANIEFTSIPATHDDLLLVVSARSDTAVDRVEGVKARFNGAVSDTNHSGRYLIGRSASTVFSGTDSICRLGYVTCAGATASTFGSLETYIPNYAGSSKKTYSSIGVTEHNGASNFDTYIAAIAGLWDSTNAIDEIELTTTGANNFVAGSSAFLYGITKA